MRFFLQFLHRFYLAFILIVSESLFRKEGNGE